MIAISVSMHPSNGRAAGRDWLTPHALDNTCAASIAHVGEYQHIILVKVAETALSGVIQWCPDGEKTGADRAIVS